MLSPPIIPLKLGYAVYQCQACQPTGPSPVALPCVGMLPDLCCLPHCVVAALWPKQVDKVRRRPWPTADWLLSLSLSLALLYSSLMSVSCLVHLGSTALSTWRNNIIFLFLHVFAFFELLICCYILFMTGCFKPPDFNKLRLKDSSKKDTYNQQF